ELLGEATIEGLTPKQSKALAQSAVAKANPPMEFRDDVALALTREHYSIWSSPLPLEKVSHQTPVEVKRPPRSKPIVRRPSSERLVTLASAQEISETFARYFPKDKPL